MKIGPFFPGCTDLAHTGLLGVEGFVRKVCDISWSGVRLSLLLELPEEIKLTA